MAPCHCNEHRVTEYERDNGGVGNIFTNQRTDFDTYNPVDNIKFLGSTKLAEVDGSVVFSSIEHLYVVSAAVSAAENIQEKQAIVF